MKSLYGNAFSNDIPVATLAWNSSIKAISEGISGISYSIQGYLANSHGLNSDCLEMSYTDSNSPASYTDMEVHFSSCVSDSFLCSMKL